MDAIAWFDAVSLADVARVGGKGANLGELTRRRPARFRRGSSSRADAYLDAMEHGGVRRELVAIEAAVDVDDPSALANASARMQELVRKAGVSEQLRREIVAAYERLGADRVAVRSSATAEDTAGTSFAGMNQYVHEHDRRGRRRRSASSTAGRRCSARASCRIAVPGASSTSPRSPSSCSRWSTPSEVA